MGTFRIFAFLHFAYILFTYVPSADGLASSQSVNCLKLLAIGRVWAAFMVSAREGLNVFCNYCRQMLFKFKPLFNTMLACDNVTNIFDTATVVAALRQC